MPGHTRRDSQESFDLVGVTGLNQVILTQENIDVFFEKKCRVWPGMTAGGLA
jgi:hypothetical protein